MQSERPYPGQLWKHEDIRAIIVAVSPTTVSYEDLSRSRAVILKKKHNLNTFRRMKRLPTRRAPTYASVCAARLRHRLICGRLGPIWLNRHRRRGLVQQA